MSKNSNRENTKLEKLVFFIVKVNNDDVFALAAQLAYNLILSFFPFLIFIMNLIAFSPLDSLNIISALGTLLPDNVLSLIATTLDEIVGTQNVGLLGVSIVLTIWSASSGFRGVVKGLNKAYNIRERRNLMKMLMISMFFTLALSMVIVLALAALVFGNLIEEYLMVILPFESVVNLLWNLIRYIAVIVIMVFVFALLYRYTPAEKIPWKEVIPGAIFSSLGWIVISLIFSFYVDNIANYSRLYGSLGAVFALMIWLYITSFILLIGAEINSVLSTRRKKY
ncbi:YihY/virulence factor BrkB family protein [Clostridium isatidis]|uniref:Ribonuclease BN n=1 Tax=Clostridium isatidis TaxID=182773 RepID=A0A343JFG6_9CLOT|nr:YihY/virulence factor BrkB family protein [Clostridium isatidis]ASW44274.1 ribonuclease BN [Clostridium isatidis]